MEFRASEGVRKREMKRKSLKIGEEGRKREEGGRGEVSI